MVGVEAAHLDDLFDLGDGDAGGGGHHGVEVHGGVAVDEVAEAVALPGLDHGEVAGDGLFEHVVAAVERPDLFTVRELLDRAVAVVEQGQAALADGRAGAGGGVKRGDARAAGPEPLGQRALGHQLDLELARQVLALELFVLAHIRRDHLLDLPGAQQDAQAEVVDPAVVRHHRQPADAQLAQGPDAVFGDTAEAKTPGQDGGPRGDVGHGLAGAGVDLVHGRPCYSLPCAAATGRGSQPRQPAATTLCGPLPRCRLVATWGLGALSVVTRSPCALVTSKGPAGSPGCRWLFLSEKWVRRFVTLC